MIVQTGYGYYIENGLKIAKYILDPGVHPNPPDSMTVVEVANQAALDAIVLDDIPLTIAQQKTIILTQLRVIDEKSIRALRTNDTGRLSDLEAQAVTLRAALVALG